MKVLISAFDPFGGDKTNSTLEALDHIPDRIKDIQVEKIVLPTVFGDSARLLEKSIEEHEPDVTICLGQAESRNRISIERVAINIENARIPDNKKNQPIDEPIVEDGPAAYMASLPIRDILAAMQNSHIPGEISNTAGTFVCNHIMYNLLHLANSKYPRMKAGFIHIPKTPAQVLDQPGLASMGLNDIKKAIEIAIEVSCESL